MELTMPKATVFEKTPVVPVGLPSELLRRRPDVIAAEADLHTAVANVGVAVADLYPRFSLTGSVSGRGNDFAQLFRENNNAWSLGGNLVQPLFQGGALRANVRAQQAAAEQAAETYRKTLITAVSEVEEALIDYGQLHLPDAVPAKGKRANKEAFRISMESYQGGETEFLNVITAQTPGSVRRNPGHHAPEYPQIHCPACPRPGRRMVGRNASTASFRPKSMFWLKEPGCNRKNTNSLLIINY